MHVVLLKGNSDHRPDWLAGRKLYRISNWRACLAASWFVLFTACPPRLGAAVLDLWAGLDSAVCSYGHLRLAGVANRRIPFCQSRTHAVPDSTCPKRLLELAVLPLAPRQAGVFGHFFALVAYRGNAGGILAHKAHGRRLTCSLSAVGQFRPCAQLFCLAAQPAAFRIAGFLPKKSFKPARLQSDD